MTVPEENNVAALTQRLAEARRQVSAAEGRLAEARTQVSSLEQALSAASARLAEAAAAAAQAAPPAPPAPAATPAQADTAPADEAHVPTTENHQPTEAELALRAMIDGYRRGLTKRGFRRDDLYYHTCRTCGEHAVETYTLVGKPGGRDIELCVACGATASWRRRPEYEDRELDATFDLAVFLR